MTDADVMDDPGGPPDAVDASHGNPHDAPQSHDPDAHGPVEDPRWVLVPLVVGLVVGLILAIVFGLGSGAQALI